MIGKRDRDGNVIVYNRNRAPYRPLNTYALTPANIINWTRKFKLYRGKMNMQLTMMKGLMREGRFPMANKRYQILKHKAQSQFFKRIASHYARLLMGVPSDPSYHIARQAADRGQLNQDLGIYRRSDHRVHNMLRTGNFTEGLNQVPYDILDEYMRRTRHERVLGRPWRVPGKYRPEEL